jgi:hypothetical protein
MFYVPKKLKPIRLAWLVGITLLGGLSAHAGLIQDLDASLTASVKTNASGVVTNWVDQSSAVD